MSKSSKAKKAENAIKKAAVAVAAAMKSANTRGQYGESIANKSLIEQLGAMTKGMHVPKKKPKLNKEERAARGRVLAAYRARAAKAARLPGKKKRTGKKKVSKAASPPAAHKPSKKRSSVKTMTADAVIKAAATGALKRWACEGPRRSGCGAGGTRVINYTGTLKRIRPPRFMTSG